MSDQSFISSSRYEIALRRAAQNIEEAQEKAGAGFTPDQHIEAAKVWAMLALARAHGPSEPSN